HVIDFVARPQVLLRRPMAVQAPLHVQARRLPRQVHLIDAPVTGGAADTLVDVNAVVEVDELRQVVDAVPGDGLVGPPALAHRLQHGTVRPDLRVAVHAGARRRQPGEGGFLDGGVAVPAVDAQAGDMVLVTERHRLFDVDLDAGDVV